MAKRKIILKRKNMRYGYPVAKNYAIKVFHTKDEALNYAIKVKGLAGNKTLYPKFVRFDEFSAQKWKLKKVS